MSGVWDDLAAERQGLHDPPGSLPDRVHARLREKVAAWACGLPQGSTVLDLGCGAGLLARRLVQLRPDLRVTGMDISEGMLKAAAQASPDKSNPAWLQGDARRWPLPDQSIDAVFAMELIVHLSPAELEAFFAEARRVCRGWLVVEVKDPRSLGAVVALRGWVDRAAPAAIREFIFGRRTLTERIPVNLHRPAQALPPGPWPRLSPWPLLPAPSHAYLIRLKGRDDAP